MVERARATTATFRKESSDQGIWAIRNWNFNLRTFWGILHSLCPSPSERTYRHQCDWISSLGQRAATKKVTAEKEDPIRLYRGSHPHFRVMPDIFWGGDFWGQMSTAGLLCKLQGQHAFSKKKTQVFFFSGVDIRCRIGGGRGAKLFFWNSRLYYLEKGRIAAVKSFFAKSRS